MIGRIVKKVKKNTKISFVVLFVILLIYTVSLLTPLLWTVLTSFKNADDWSWALSQKDAWGVVWTKKFEFSNFVLKGTLFLPFFYL